MPSASWNLKTWDAEYDWPQAGDEWSEAWGGSEAHWYGALLPRIHRFFRLAACWRSPLAMAGGRAS
jgi:hypothetical protein